MRPIFFTVSLLALFFLKVLAIHREYYDILGVATSASEAEIKKAYRTLSTQYHPDRNHGDEEAHRKFVQIANAYEVLSNSEKRRKYDQMGPDFEKQEQQQNNFNPFFQQQPERKGPELAIKLPVTLEDIYKGKEIGVFQTKQIICPHCRATGADDPDHVHHCSMCGGQGFVLHRQQVGPGFFQQFQVPCDRCGGRGKVYTSTCHVCRGAKVMPGTDRISLYVEKGARHGQRIVFPNHGNEYSEIGASDVSFIVIETPHPRFRREGDHLRVAVDISLGEALLGFEKTLIHLDGHTVHLKKDGVTQPGFTEAIRGEGMPQHGFSSYHGDLFVEYRVTLPDRLTSEQTRVWKEYFGPN